MSNRSGWFRGAHSHLHVGHSSNFSEHPVRLLRIVDQKVDPVTDDFALNVHQSVGQGEHLDNIRRQPFGGKQRMQKGWSLLKHQTEHKSDCKFVYVAVLKAFSQPFCFVMMCLF